MKRPDYTPIRTTNGSQKCIDRYTEGATWLSSSLVRNLQTRLGVIKHHTFYAGTHDNC